MTVLPDHSSALMAMVAMAVVVAFIGCAVVLAHIGMIRTVRWFEARRQLREQARFAALPYGRGTPVVRKRIARAA